MDRRIWRAVAAAGLALAATPVAAGEDPWTVEATAASEYISKGAGRSDGQPHLALLVQRGLGGDAYVGAWTGSLRAPLGADAESHLYFGWRPRAAGWTFDVRPTFKVLVNARDAAQTELWEYRLEAARPIAGARFRLRVEHTPDGFGASRASTWTDAALSRRLGDSAWTVSGGVGRREQETGRDYTAWNLGVQRRLGETLSADLRWVDTDETAAGREYDGRLVFGLTAALR
ncbi:MAG: TorF family putative porin [Pseudomonadota bacterium]